MTFCWAQDPADRPSASEIFSIANTPEFSHLQNAIRLEGQLEVSCASAAPTWQLLDKPGGFERGCLTSVVDTLWNVYHCSGHLENGNTQIRSENDNQEDTGN